jgi:hypothetical protein
MTRQDIEKQKKRLFKMYLKALLTTEEFTFYLNKLDESPIKKDGQ